MGFPRIIIHSDSQVVVNSINAKIGILKEILNLIEGIRCLLTQVKDTRVLIEIATLVLLLRWHITKDYMYILFKKKKKRKMFQISLTHHPNNKKN